MTGATPTQRADARRSADAILRAAREVLAERSDADLAAVAERAHVHRVTLYRHFRTREALISALHHAWLDDAEAAVLATNLDADDLWAEVEGLIRRVYEVHLEWRTYGWVPGYSSGTPARRRREHVGNLTSPLFTKAQAQGLLRQDLNERELMAAWAGSVIYLTGNIAEGKWTLDEVVAYTMRLIAARDRVAQPRPAELQPASGSA